MSYLGQEWHAWCHKNQREVDLEVKASRWLTGISTQEDFYDSLKLVQQYNFYRMNVEKESSSSISYDLLYQFK